MSLILTYLFIIVTVIIIPVLLSLTKRVVILKKSNKSLGLSCLRYEKRLINIEQKIDNMINARMPDPDANPNDPPLDPAPRIDDDTDKSNNSTTDNTGTSDSAHSNKQ